MPKQCVKLIVSQPLRARDVTTLVKTAMRYAADITVKKHGFHANGRSCFDLLALTPRDDSRQFVFFSCRSFDNHK